MVEDLLYEILLETVKFLKTPPQGSRSLIASERSLKEHTKKFGILIAHCFPLN